VLPTALLALALAAPPFAAAVPASDEVKRLTQLSIREYEALEFDRALADAVKAFELSGAAGLLYNIGQCHRALAHWRQAELAFRNYLREKPDAPNRGVVLMLISEMQDKETEAPPKAQPQAAPPPAAVVAPAAAVAPPPVVIREEARSRSSAWPWVLGVAAVAAAGVSVWGWVQVASFESLKNPHTTVSVAQAQSSQSAAAVGEPVGIVGAVAVAGLATGLVLTW
jgi:tetratricopeptide (TPR) repeat protein